MTIIAGTQILAHFVAPPQEIHMYFNQSRTLPSTPTGKILALDPGPTQTAWLIYDTAKCSPVDSGIEENDRIRVPIEGEDYDLLAIEMIASYGMAVGAEVFNTCRWIGKFEAWKRESAQFRLVFRKDVKMFLCGSFRAKDPNVREAIIDRYGGKQTALGNKKQPGPLYGISSHKWAALAVAICAAESVGLAEAV